LPGESGYDNSVMIMEFCIAMYLGSHLCQFSAVNCFLVKSRMDITVNLVLLMCRKFLTGQDTHWRLLLASGNTEVHLPIMMVLIQALDMRFYLRCDVVRLCVPVNPFG